MTDVEDSLELAKRFSRMADALTREQSAEDTLQSVVDLAPAAVAGAEHAGVTVLSRAGRLRSAATSDDLVAKVDRAQRETEEGPCLEASEEPKVVWVPDMTTETRWPRFAEAATRLGVGSMIACNLPAGRGTRGALNLHASEPDAFDPAAVETAEIFTAHAASALRQATLMESLRAGMASRQVIGEATGILMERGRVSSQQAFARLVAVSQSRNVKLRTVAEHVVRTGQDPETAGDLSG